MTFDPRHSVKQGLHHLAGRLNQIISGAEVL